ncbi:hypothetical protein [Nocardia sp. NPDC052112]|uniref:hypothetical protein n=1 Tax=Nocardia sp. NPDC052112 TaxID=3155646 RepID=UPI0034295606
MAAAEAAHDALVEAGHGDLSGTVLIASPPTAAIPLRLAGKPWHRSGFGTLR